MNRNLRVVPSLPLKITLVKRDNGNTCRCKASCTVVNKYKLYKGDVQHISERHSNALFCEAVNIYQMRA